MRRAWLASRTRPATVAVTLTVCARSFHGFPDAAKERRLRSSSIAINKPRGRDLASDDFERRIHLVTADSLDQLYRNATEKTAVVDLVAMEDVEAGIIQHPSTVPLYTQTGLVKMPRSLVKNLRRNADVWTAPATSSVPDAPTIIHLVDPVINHKMYRREEAQVELITAFRNVLYEFHDSQTYGGNKKRHVHTLRIPALSLYTADRFQDDLGKLNQQSIIKGFNRCGQEIKDWFALNATIKIEIFVPGCFISQFERAFAEDAWPPMLSVADPGRTTLYRGLPPPRTLLDYPGWHGNRPELLAAVETEGKSIEDARETDPKLLTRSKENYRIGMAANPRSLKE